MHRTLFRLLCLLLAFAVTSVQAQPLTEEEIAEYQVKALFLYNFANFVEWPDSAFISANAPLKLCLYGEVPFGLLLDEVDGTLIGDRELRIMRSQTMSDLKSGCQILFVGADQRARLPELWKHINYLYVLSMGEQQGFADSGGIVNILRTTDQVQFEINISNALSNGLFISSDLLSLAREIKENTGSPDNPNTPETTEP